MPAKVKAKKRFEYSGRTPEGQLQEGVIAAANREAAITELQARQLSVTICEPIKEQRTVEQYLALIQAVKFDQIAYFSRTFSALLDAGIPVFQALESCAEQQDNPKFKAIIETVIDDVGGGEALAPALGKHPEVFDSLYTAMVRAGEESGDLPGALRELAVQLEASLKLRREIKGATMYPKVVLSFAFIIVSFLLIVIVPKFAELFKQTVASAADPSKHLSAALPAPTQFVLDISYALYPKPGAQGRTTMWWAGVGLRAIILIVAIYALRRLWKVALRKPKIHKAWDRFKMRAPMKIGPLVQKIAVARFARTFASLLRAGVPATEAMEIVADASGNAVIAEAVLAAREAMLSGTSIAAPIARSKAFPPMVNRFIQTGEEAGNLTLMLTKLAGHYEEEVDTQIKGLKSLIEPLMIMVVGGVIGAIVIVTYLPMFKIYDLIG